MESRIIDGISCQQHRCMLTKLLRTTCIDHNPRSFHTNKTQEGASEILIRSQVLPKDKGIPLAHVFLLGRIDIQKVHERVTVLLNYPGVVRNRRPVFGTGFELDLADRVEKGLLNAGY